MVNSLTVTFNFSFRVRKPSLENGMVSISAKMFWLLFKLFSSLINPRLSLVVLRERVVNITVLAALENILLEQLNKNIKIVSLTRIYF